MSNSRDPYEILGVARGASPDEIKSAFRVQAKKHHPDMNPGDPAAVERFKEISQAYDALTDPRPQMGAQPNNFREFHFTTDHFHNIDQMFADIFGRQARAARNSDVQTFCDLTLEQAFYGCEMDVAPQFPNAPKQRIKIPRGVDNGTRIRVPNQGMHENLALPAGDLYVIVRLHPHAVFTRQGPHLLAKVEVDSLDAILGATAQLTMIDGTTMVIPIPPGSQFGDQLKIADRGMYGLSSPQRGDVYIQLDLKTPRQLTEKHRSLIAKLLELLPKAI